ncbi:MAG TPA: hypothetical protein VHM30_04775, partial [Gemmatimonadaceae bacterium]|nr:hypothetical protein [Gemmatimonadaceae bacterium]
MATRTRFKPGVALRALADKVGIIPEYRDMTGRETRVTTDEARVALLAAMGIDASTDEKAEAALATLAEEERMRIADSVRVLPRAGDFDGIEVDLGTRGDLGAVEWSAELEEENGVVRRSEGRGRAGPDGRLRVRVPFNPALGYHTFTLEVRFPHGEASVAQSLIVVPPACPSPTEVLEGRK